MEEIFGQWYNPLDSSKIKYYFYHVKNGGYIFNTWNKGSLRMEYSKDDEQFKKLTRFKLTLIW